METSLGTSSQDKIFIIIPAHNRKQKTIGCLERLAQDHTLMALSIIVVDDGSTDGTDIAIRSQYPNVNVLKGNGYLWWTGAIALGMQYAYAQFADYILWLNDDTLPALGTLQTLVAFCQTHPKTIAASQCYYDGAFTYGGQTRQRFRQTPMYATPGTIADCDALDGNAVCLPRSVISDVGYPLAKHTPHYGGDNLYTWSAKQAGYQLCLLGDAISICPRDHPKISWTLDPEPIWKHWQAATSPKTSYYFPGYYHFCIRYWGLWGIVPFMRPYLRLTLFTALRIALPRQWLYFLREKFGTTKSS